MLSRTISSFMALVLTVSFGFQSLAQAETLQERNRALIAKTKGMDIKNMSMAELEQGLQELRLNLRTLNEDLELAEIRADHRTAVKVRNGIALGAAALVLLMFAAEIKYQDGGGFLSGMLFAILGAGMTLGAQGYIYLTNTELNDMKSTVSRIESKIARIDRKIKERKAGVN